MKIRRYYRKSSSFKVATLFAVLLGVAVITLSLSVFLLARQNDSGIDNPILLVLSIASIVSLIFVAMLGYLVSVFVVSRINRISGIADEIVKTGDLSKRITLDSRWDDLSFLSGVLNEMLDRIETLMEGVQHITDTVAHDLRTPLTRLRNKLEKADQNTETKTELIREVDGLLKTFNALLNLSSIESGRQSTKFEYFDLEKVVNDAVGFYTPLAQDKNQTITLTTVPVQYLGNKDLFFQVVANILDNAIKFTPVGGDIHITIKKITDGHQFIVRDSGPGIAEGCLDKVFDRFYREESNTQKEGSGLGLSLAKAVLKLHGAQIMLKNAEPGLSVSIHLPDQYAGRAK